MLELDFLSLVPAELFIIAAVVYVIVEVIKKTNKIQDWCLPIIAFIVAIILTIAYTAVILAQGLNAVTVVNGIIYGVLIAAVAVYSNQLIKQIVLKR